MKKEILIAVLAGLAFGLIVVYGVKTAQTSLTARNATVKPTPLLTKDTNMTANHTLLITSPEPDEIVTDNPVQIVGTTSPGSLISLTTSTDESVTAADAAGTFSATINLDPGPNTVSVTSYNEIGDESVVKFTLVLSSADLNATAAATKAAPKGNQL